MPRWFPIAVAIAALAYGGFMTYAYINEKDENEARSKSAAIFGAGYLERRLPAVWAEEHPDEMLTDVVCVLREGHNYKCVGTSVPSQESLAEMPADVRAETRKSLSMNVGFEVTLNQRNGKFVTERDGL